MPQETVRGDIDGDGNVTSTDATIVYRFVNGSYQLDEAQAAAADVNGDNNVDSVDAAMVYRYANG